MGRIKRSLALVKASWQMLKKNKRLLIFPIISAFMSTLILAVMAIPFIKEQGNLSTQSITTSTIFWHIGLLYLFYMLSNFVMTFFNSAIIFCAADQLQGKPVSMRRGLRAAVSRLHVIFTWSLISATIGMIIHAIEERSSFIGQIVMLMIGMSWVVVSFFALPVIVLENKNPISAFKEIQTFIKKTWGESALSIVGMNFLFTLLSLPALALIGLVMMTSDTTIIIAVVTIVIIYCLLLSLVSSTLKTILRTSLYLYAKNGQAPTGFPEKTLALAVHPRGIKL